MSCGYFVFSHCRLCSRSPRPSVSCAFAPAMIHSLKLGGLSEDLAKDIGLYDVLSVPLRAVAKSSASSGDAISSRGQEVPVGDEAREAKKEDREERPGGTAQTTERVEMLADEAPPGPPP